MGTPWKISMGFGIAALAAALFLINITSQEFFGDNVGYAFRSLGYLDYLGTGLQTQPVDWYVSGDLPWWTRLSFHDHPPLVFLIQNLFFKFFGSSVLVARLPGLISGFLSIWLMYAVVGRVFQSSTWAILSALALAVNTGSAAMFRSALIEPVQMLLILSSIYLFFVFLDRPKFFWFLGVSLGLLMMAKYTGIFLIATMMAYTAVWRRDIFTKKEFYLAALIALLIFSPVIIYNIFLYLDRGHFDLQISTILGQKVAAWPEEGLLGKLQSPFVDIFKNARVLFDPASLGFALLGAIILGIAIFKRSPMAAPQWTKSGSFFLLYFLFLTAMLLAAGSAHRFLFLYAPIVALLTGFLAYAALTVIKWRPLGAILAAAIFVFSFWHSYKANVVQTIDYGIVKLDRYFKTEFAGRPSAIIPETQNRHLNKVIHDFSERKTEGRPHFSVVVYNDNVDLTTILWVFARRFFYENIPTMDVLNFQQIVAKEGPGYFKGFTIYFVQSAPKTLFNPKRGENEIANAFEKNLIAQSLKPASVIRSDEGREFFRVYKFEL
jgi:hypothetical protein